MSRARQPVPQPFRCVLIVPSTDLAASTAIVAAFPNASPIPVRPAFSIPLSSTGDSPVTHYACHVPVMRELIVRLQDALRTGELSGFRWYRWDTETNILVGTNSPDELALRRRPWSWAASLADVGLWVVDREVPP